MIPQAGFARHRQEMPKQPHRNANYFKLLKVVKIRPDAGFIVAVDDNGAMYNEITILSPLVTTNSGITGLHHPSVINESDIYNTSDTGRRDVYAIVGFLDNLTSKPFCVGFMCPELNQMHFKDDDFPNQILNRHAGDNYTRIEGESVKELSGRKDKITKEEHRYADDSYSKVSESGDHNLADLGAKNVDNDVRPHKVKKEERKDFFFQHSSNSRILVDKDGDLRIALPDGTYINFSTPAKQGSPVGSGTGTPSGNVINSEISEPTSAPTDAREIEVVHKTGSKIRIAADGEIFVDGVVNINVISAADTVINASGDVSVTASGDADIDATNINATATVKADVTAPTVDVNAAISASIMTLTATVTATTINIVGSILATLTSAVSVLLGVLAGGKTLVTSDAITPITNHVHTHPQGDTGPPKDFNIESAVTIITKAG